MMYGRMDANIDGETDGNLEHYKTNIANFETAFAKNYARFNEFKILVYESSLTQQDKQALTAMQRPTLEANMLPAMISRLLGEFSAQEFAFEIIPSEELERKYEQKQKQTQPILPSPPPQMQGQMQPSSPGGPPQQHQQPIQPPMFAPPSPIKVQDIKLAELLGKHLNYLINSANNHDLQYQVMKDLLVGGWSVIEIELAYDHAMSMIPKMKFTLPDDRTMCFFDARARLEDKSDGDFCGKKFHMTKSDFELYYPDANIKELKFEQSSQDNLWSYRNDNQDVLVVCDYYYKVKTPLDIVQLSTGDVMPLAVYKKLKDEMKLFKVGDTRKTVIEKIHHCRFIGNQRLEERETEFKGLPLIFVRGDGDFIKHGPNQALEEQLLPYIYHAKDAQRFKNYTMNSLANEIENVIQHKLIVAQEAYPTQPQWQEPFHDYQNAAVLFIKTRYEDTGEPIPNPIMPVQRMNAPPEIMQAYMESDRTINNLLGTNQAPAQTNTNDLSGIAIMQAQMQSNPTAMPYITGMSHGLQRVAQVYIDTLPELIHHYDNLPIVNDNAKKDKIDLSGDIKKQFNYFPSQLRVDIKVGASYAIQKQQSLMMVSKLMQMSPQLGQFFSTKGLPYILDNLEGKNIDALKLEVEDWVNQQAQMQQQQQQMAMQQQQQELQNNPAMIKAQVDQQKLQLDSQQMQLEHKMQMLELELKHADLDGKLHIAHEKNKMDMARAAMDDKARAHDISLKAADMANKHVKDLVETHHSAKDMEHRHAKENAETIHLIQSTPREGEEKS